MFAQKDNNVDKNNVQLPKQPLQKQLFTLKRLVDSFILIKRFAIFVLILVIGFLIYKLLISYTFTDRNFATGLFALWLITAYLALPRLHKILTSMYVPNYYIGRARTGEGLLGDPVNLAIIASREKLIVQMEKAGWQLADNLNLRTTYKMIKATLLRRSYPSAPVSALYLFGNKQDLAFQKEVGGSTSKRHHVRFWKTPDNWFLPGGRTADWMGAATYDSKVGLSIYTFQFTHKIGENTDEERDHVIKTLQETSKSTQVQVVEHFSTGYHSRNGGGDTIRTDGSMPFIQL